MCGTDLWVTSENPNLLFNVSQKDRERRRRSNGRVVTMSTC